MVEGIASGRLLKIDEGVISGIAAALIPPPPFLGSTEHLTGELPIEEIGFLLLVPVGLHDDVLVLPADSLDFPKSAIQLVAVQIVERGDRDYQVEALVGKWQARSVRHLQMWTDLFLRVRYPICGDVNPTYFEARDGLGELVQQEGLSTTDVEDAAAGLEPIMLGHGLGYGTPASVVLVAAVTEPAVAIPILTTEALRHLGALRFGVLDHALHVVPLGTGVQRGEEIDACHGPSYELLSAAKAADALASCACFALSSSARAPEKRRRSLAAG